MTPITLIGGARHGQIVNVNAPARYIECPIVSDDGRWVHCATYDGLSGQWLRDGAPFPMDVPILQPAWDLDADERACPGWWKRVRLRAGLLVAGLTEADLDHGDDW